MHFPTKSYCNLLWRMVWNVSVYWLL